MIALILSLLSLVIALFGMYAFVVVMQKPASVKLSILDLQELSGLPEDVKKLYNKTVIDIIVPAFNRVIKKTYADLIKTTPYADIEKGAVESAKAFVVTIESMQQPTKEAFSNYIEKRVSLY